MQNPGSDAGVFVLTATPTAELMSLQRDAEAKPSRCLRYPGYAQRGVNYTSVCVDNRKKILGESRKPNRQCRSPQAKLYRFGAKSKLIQIWSNTERELS
jgi:hypothetical protein